MPLLSIVFVWFPEYTTIPIIKSVFRITQPRNKRFFIFTGTVFSSSPSKWRMNPLNELFHDFQPGRTRTEIVPGRSETVPGKFYILNPKIIPTLYSKRPTLNCTKPKTVLKPKTVPKLRGGRFLFRIWLSRRCLTCSEPLFIPNFEAFKIHNFLVIFSYHVVEITFFS